MDTAGQLTDEFRDVARAARTLGMLPPDGVGPVSVGLSKLAARLKVQQSVYPLKTARLGPAASLCAASLCCPTKHVPNSRFRSSHLLWSCELYPSDKRRRRELTIGYI